MNFRASLRLAVPACCLLALLGCSNAERDLDRARAAHTPEAFRAYALKYPSSDRVIRVVGTFTGHAIMIGDDGSFHAGISGGIPEYEIRSAARPELVYKLSANDAIAAGMFEGGTMQLTGDYTYTGAEMIVFVGRVNGVDGHVLVHFQSGQISHVKDNGSPRSSKGRPLAVLLLRPAEESRGR